MTVTRFVGWGRQEGQSGAHTHRNGDTFREKDGEMYNEREEDRGERGGWGGRGEGVRGEGYGTHKLGGESLVDDRGVDDGCVGRCSWECSMEWV